MRTFLAFGESETAPVGISNWPLYEGRFVGQAILRLGGIGSPTVVIPAGVDTPNNLEGRLQPPEGEEEEDESDLTIRVVNLSGSDLVVAGYEDADRTEGNGTTLTSKGKMIADGELAITESDYDEPVSTLYMGERVFLRVVDPDRDLSSKRATRWISRWRPSSERRKSFSSRKPSAIAESLPVPSV